MGSWAIYGPEKDIKSHRTEEGARNRDVIMSVMGTMKLRGRDFFIHGKNMC
ncbi:MAG: hypothetical protein SVY15_03075 [Halobacteriota archaeon]|nr:hypothetical protein [Halobacteriota archaeon]